LTDPEAKESAEIISIAETIMDEVITQLLTEAADKVLKEEEKLFVKTLPKYECNICWTMFVTPQCHLGFFPKLIQPIITCKFSKRFIMDLLNSP
jgi:hypothetical protein